MNTSDYDYALPPELIAQEPLPGRAQSRMMVLHRDGGALEHRHVTDLPGLLAAGDLLVVNDTRVIPARVFGRREDTGGKVELLLVEETEAGAWSCLWRASGRARPGCRLDLAGGRVRGEILAGTGDGRVLVRLASADPLLEVLEDAGAPPLPPYIRRPPGPSAATPLDRERYQTVYAEQAGAVAAPTAGLHFTRELLDDLAGRGVPRAAVTLHVGPGTFRPVRAERVADHVMDEERFALPASTARAIGAARERGGRVVAVGTTTVRTLESVAREDGSVAAASGRTALFIHEPYRFRAVDAMLTNFHLPRSTLIMMVCAFAGRERVLAAYAAAVRRAYRFYSYGDCMLIV